jgi:hypothetical protein
LLTRFAAEAAALGVTVELVEGRLEELDEYLADRKFDLVCAHGLLMYLDNRVCLATLAARVAPQGRLSLTFRNGHSLAMRPGLRRDWAGALASFDARHYVNEMGISARADRLEDVEHNLAHAGMRIVEWFGVRVFNDAIPADMTIPDNEDLNLLLKAEEQAGRQDPYRWMASQLHVIATTMSPQ